MTPGTRIKQLRLEKKMSQKKLADLAGVSQPTISDYENDEIREHRAHILFKIAVVLGTNPEFILTGKGEKALSAIGASFDELVAIYSTLPEESRAALLVVAKTMKSLI